MTDQKRNIAILGSTGSIGTQALDVVRSHADKLAVEVLTANSNSTLLIQQAIEFKPNVVVIGNEDKYQEVFDALDAHDIQVFAGNKAIADVVTYPSINMVLTAMVGYAGLLPTINAIESGKHIALANKETLVVAGEIIMGLADKHGVEIIPVDSEHSAIYQCLVGETYESIEKIYLTASVGPFRGRKADQLAAITKAQALKHPNWEMGAKITIDSASMMNKGLEVIEAKWLFNLKPEQVDVIVHPQSIVHSIAQFRDGSMKAQLGLPDMKLPIQYALGFPKRLDSDFERFNFINYPALTFEQPDKETFRNLALAYEAMHAAGNIPCIMNAANEVVVDAFLKDRVGFLQMSDVIGDCMQKVNKIEKPSYEDYVASDSETRSLALEMINKLN